MRPGFFFRELKFVKFYPVRPIPQGLSLFLWECQVVFDRQTEPFFLSFASCLGYKLLQGAVHNRARTFADNLTILQQGLFEAFLDLYRQLFTHLGLTFALPRRYSIHKGFSMAGHSRKSLLLSFVFAAFA